MKEKVIKITKIVLVVLLSIVALFIILMPNKALDVVDNLLHVVTGNYYFSDQNEKINKDEVIKVAKNKDYSNSIFYPYYELLNDNQKEVYNDIITNANNYNKEFNVSQNINSMELNDIFKSVLYDHPEIFYLEPTISFLVNQKDEVITVRLNYISIIDDIENAKITFDSEIDKIVNEAKKIDSDYEKELYVHDTLINMLEYDTNLQTNLNVYDAITTKKALCDGYTKLFQIIMMKLNIPTYYIVGQTNDRHSWNLIELEDGFYNVDITWDDQVDRIIYSYFNVNDKMIESSHKKIEISTKIKRDNGDKYLNKLSPLYK